MSTLTLKRVEKWTREPETVKRMLENLLLKITLEKTILKRKKEKENYVLKLKIFKVNRYGTTTIWIAFLGIWFVLQLGMLAARPTKPDNWLLNNITNNNSINNNNNNSVMMMTWTKKYFKQNHVPVTHNGSTISINKTPNIKNNNKQITKIPYSINETLIIQNKTKIISNQTNKTVNAIASPEMRISNHECFSKSDVDECHFTNETTPYDCMWCEYWCVHKRTKKEGCYELSDQLEKVFSRPVITEIKPSFAFSDIPTMISIYGSFLDVHSSNYIYNTVTKIVFNDVHICDIHSRNYSTVRCILEAINKTQTLTLKLSFTRVVYDLNDTEEMYTKHRINVHQNEEIDRSMEQNQQPGPFQIHQLLIGLTIGTVVCSLAWISYIKRQYVDQATQIVRRRFILHKMKEILIEKKLYKEFANIQLKNKLGEGNFGEVYSAMITEYSNGTNNTTEMAIKKLKKGANLSKVKMFITEGIRMSMFQNDRILCPVAIFYDKNQMPSIVLPIMKNGDLCRYLRQNTMLPTVQLLTFALQVTEGMEYLSSINFVHGDLAARNCLLDENMQIKIGDFGMSRHLYRTDYVTINYIDRPIRWMALECFSGKNPKFTIKSDVWSYGVVLWEIFTIGSHPYEEFDNVDVCRHILDGYRLHRPTNCPDLIYQMMSKCWSISVPERPTFSSIKQELSEILAAIANGTNNGGNGGENTVSLIINRDQYNYTNLGEVFIRSGSSTSSSTNTTITTDTSQTRSDSTTSSRNSL